MKRFAIRIINALRYITWKIDALKISGISSTVSDLQFDDNDRVLIIAPHADDELIGCHTLITNHIEQTKIFYCQFLGSNASDKNRAARESEFCGYMQNLGTDNFVIADNDKLEIQLRDLIGQYKPTYIALPSFIDWHPEHRNINILLSEIISDNASISILWYQISIPIPAQYVNVVYRMNNRCFLNKWSSFNAHYHSQRHMDIGRFKFIEKTCCRSSETYLIQNTTKWKDNVLRLRAIEPDLNSLKETLGNVGKMYRQSERYYSLLK